MTHVSGPPGGDITNWSRYVSPRPRRHRPPRLPNAIGEAAKLSGGGKEPKWRRRERPGRVERASPTPDSARGGNRVGLARGKYATGGSAAPGNAVPGSTGSGSTGSGSTVSGGAERAAGGAAGGAAGRATGGGGSRAGADDAAVPDRAEMGGTVPGRAGVSGAAGEAVGGAGHRVGGGGAGDGQSVDEHSGRLGNHSGPRREHRPADGADLRRSPARPRASVAGGVPGMAARVAGWAGR